MSTVAVYRSRNSRCCILINEDKKFVQYISTEEDSGEINTDIRKMDAREFHAEYKELETYPVLRAVEHYQNPLTAAIRITDRATKCLNQLRTDKGIAMNDQNRLSLSERNVLATHKAGIAKAGPCPDVAPCTTTEVVPGSSKKQKKGAWDHKETATESNNDAQRVAVRKHKESKAKAAKKAARQEKRKQRMTEQTENTEVKNEQEAAPQAAKKPAKKPAAKKAATTKAEPKAKPTKPAAKKAASKKPATKEATKTNSKENTVTTKNETAKKTTAKKAAKAPAKKAAAKKAAPAKKASKLAKGTGKKAAAASKAPAKKAGKAAPQEGARRGRKGAFDEGQKINLLTKDNPKREGTAAYDTFEQLRKSKTVGDFFAAGGSSASLHWNIERGYIEVV